MYMTHCIQNKSILIIYILIFCVYLKKNLSQIPNLIKSWSWLILLLLNCFFYTTFFRHIYLQYHDHYNFNLFLIQNVISK